jgi:hypothetical protein
MAFTMSPLLVPSKCDVEPRNAVRSGGRSILGNEQRVMGDAGFLTARFEIPIFTPEKARAFRAMKTRLRMGEEIDVRVWDNNKPLGIWESTEVNPVALFGTHPLRSTQITMSAVATVIDEGTLFSIGSRLHIVTLVVSGGGSTTFRNPFWNGESWNDDEPWSDADPSARNVVVNIFPPLRSSVTGGTSIQMANLTMRGVLADLSEGDLSLDNAGRNGSATLTIQESF